MTREVILHPEAEIEILEALDWYAERSALAARAFVYELNGVLVRAARARNTWPRAFRDTRSIIFPHFPFSLVYRSHGDTIEIVAVAHQRRRPAYWKNR
jgi:plasmid stabilization system protein ParE